MFQTGLHELNFRLCSVNFTWVKPSWNLLETRLKRTLLEIGFKRALLETGFHEQIGLQRTSLQEAPTELYLRLDWMNFTWDCIPWTLLETALETFYWDWAPKNFTWGCTHWTLLETGLAEFYFRLGSKEFYLRLDSIDSRLHSMNFTWDCTWWFYFRLDWMNFTLVKPWWILPEATFTKAKFWRFSWKIWANFSKNI